MHPVSDRIERLFDCHPTRWILARITMRVSTSLSTVLLIGVVCAVPVTDNDASHGIIARDISASEAHLQELFASASSVASAALAQSTGKCTADNVVVRKEWYDQLSFMWAYES